MEHYRRKMSFLRCSSALTSFMKTRRPTANGAGKPGDLLSKLNWQRPGEQAECAVDQEKPRQI
jgi:hypothetical protein